jgi:hypothetical protein
MDRWYRTSLDHCGKHMPVVITELRALAWRLAVDQPVRPYAADARCVTPRATVIDLGDRHKPTGPVPVFRLFRKSP